MYKRMVTILVVVSPFVWLGYEATHHYNDWAVLKGIIVTGGVWVAVLMNAALEKEW